MLFQKLTSDPNEIFCQAAWIVIKWFYLIYYNVNITVLMSEVFIAMM